jgi:hypothetical protein
MEKKPNKFGFIFLFRTEVPSKPVSTCDIFSDYPNLWLSFLFLWLLSPNTPKENKITPKENKITPKVFFNALKKYSHLGNI